MNYYFIVYAHRCTAYGNAAWFYKNRIVQTRHPLIWWMRASEEMGYSKEDFKLLFYDKIPAEVVGYPDLESFYNENTKRDSRKSKS